MPVISCGFRLETTSGDVSHSVFFKTASVFFSTAKVEIPSPKLLRGVACVAWPEKRFHPPWRQMWSLALGTAD